MNRRNHARELRGGAETMRSNDAICHLGHHRVEAAELEAKSQEHTMEKHIGT